MDYDVFTCRKCGDKRFSLKNSDLSSSNLCRSCLVLKIEKLQALVEKRQTEHWDMAACKCDFCVEARSIGCMPREKYLRK